MSIEKLLDRYCEAWNVAEAARAPILAEVWAEGATYSDPTAHAIRAEGLLAHIAATRAAFPPFRIERVSAVDAHNDVARFAWRAAAEDGSVLVEGIDIVVFDAAREKIARIIGFFGPLDTTEPGV